MHNLLSEGFDVVVRLDVNRDISHLESSRSSAESDSVVELKRLCKRWPKSQNIIQ